MNTSGMPLTNSTTSARRLYMSPVIQILRYRQPVVRVNLVPVDEPHRDRSTLTVAGPWLSTFAPTRSQVIDLAIGPNPIHC